MRPLLGTRVQLSRLPAGATALRDRKELGGRQVERVRDAIDVYEPKISLTPLDAADVRAVEFGPFGERLLGQPSLRPDLAHGCAKGL